MDKVSGFPVLSVSSISNLHETARVAGKKRRNRTTSFKYLY